VLKVVVTLEGRSPYSGVGSWVVKCSARVFLRLALMSLGFFYIKETTALI